MPFRIKIYQVHANLSTLGMVDYEDAFCFAAAGAYSLTPNGSKLWIECCFQMVVEVGVVWVMGEGCESIWKHRWLVALVFRMHAFFLT